MNTMQYFNVKVRSKPLHHKLMNKGERMGLPLRSCYELDNCKFELSSNLSEKWEMCPL